MILKSLKDYGDLINSIHITNKVAAGTIGLWVTFTTLKRNMK